MENLIAIQLQWIAWLQGLGEWLTKPMEFFSLIGTEYFFLLAAPAIYWCWDTTLGLQAGLLLMVNANLNSYLKIIFHTPRPFWISNTVKPFAFESSFGLPSGHAQNSMAFWGMIGAYFRKRWLWGLVILLVFLIGISRLYLAVHFPHDVLIGWLVGCLILWLFLMISRPIAAWIKQRAFFWQVMIILAFSLFLILFGVLAPLAVSNFELPVEWVNNAASAYPDENPIAPFDISGIVSNAGAFFGLAAGACWLRQQGGFHVKGTLPQLLGRYLIGALGVIALWAGLDRLFPEGVTWLPFIFRYIRYMLVGLWVTALAPMVFIKLRLARKLTA